MSFQRTSIFLTADDRKIIRTLQQRYGLSTMSETMRFALRIALASEPKATQRHVPAQPSKVATPSEQLHRLITHAQHINQRVDDRVRRNETFLTQRQARLKALDATRGTSPGASGRSPQ